MGARKRGPKAVYGACATHDGSGSTANGIDKKRKGKKAKRAAALAEERARVAAGIVHVRLETKSLTQKKSVVIGRALEDLAALNSALWAEFSHALRDTCAHPTFAHNSPLATARNRIDYPLCFLCLSNATDDRSICYS